MDDLARLAAQRVWERLEAGTLAVNIRDLVALMRLAAEFEQDAGRPDPRWEATLAELLWLARRHLGEQLGGVRCRRPRQSAPRGYVGAPSAKASWGWYESVSQMPWRVQTFWLAGRRTGKRLLAISAVSGRTGRPRRWW